MNRKVEAVGAALALTTALTVAGCGAHESANKPKSPAAGEVAKMPVTPLQLGRRIIKLARGKGAQYEKPDHTLTATFKTGDGQQLWLSAEMPLGSADPADVDVITLAAGKDFGLVHGSQLNINRNDDGSWSTECLVDNHTTSDQYETKQQRVYEGNRVKYDSATKATEQLAGTLLVADTIVGNVIDMDQAGETIPSPGDLCDLTLVKNTG